MRIDKLLADSTPLSRREIKLKIKRGSVMCNGETVTDPSLAVDGLSARVFLDGQIITYNKYTYLMFNKPAGCVSATQDNKYPVVTDYVPKEYSHIKLFPAGRLDYNTHGLMILTNDGDFAHRILSPKNHIPKVYFVKSEKPLKTEDVKLFSEGIKLAEDFVTLPAKLQISKDDPCESYVTIHEGKYHQVKRMFEAADNKVVYLKRISIGSLVLDSKLEEGECRPLTTEEIDNLV